MPKLTIAGLQQQLADATGIADAARVERDAARSEAYQAKKARDEAIKDRDAVTIERLNMAQEIARYRGMIEMLERLGTIPKVEQPSPFDEYGRPRAIYG